MPLEPQILQGLQPPTPPDILGPYQKLQALRTQQLQQADIASQVQERQAIAQQRQLAVQKQQRMSEILSGATVDASTGAPDPASPAMQQLFREFPEVHSSLMEHYSKVATDKTTREHLAAETKNLGTTTEEKNYQSWREASQLPDNASTRLQFKIQGTKLTPGEIIPGAPGQPPIASAPFKPPEPTGDFEKVFLPARAKQLNKVYDPQYAAPNAMTPEEVTQANTDYAQRAQDPAARESAQALRELNLQLKQAQLNQQPTREGAKATAEDIVNHRIAPEQLSQLFGGFGATGQAYKRMVMEEARKIAPGFNFEEASAEYNLVKSPQFQQQIRFIDHVANTIPRLQASATALGNTSVKALNALLVKGQEQFGGTNIKTFITDREVVGNELGRVLSGGGTGSQTSDAKIAAAKELIDKTDSPAQIAATLKEVAPLLKSRRGTLTHGTYLENTNMAEPGAAAPGWKIINVK